MRICGRKIFTLIELLLIVAILAILIGVLLPALNSAREAALGAGCVNNLKTCGQGFALYANDFLDYLPRINVDSHKDAAGNPVKYIPNFGAYGIWESHLAADYFNIAGPPGKSKYSFYYRNWIFGYGSPFTCSAVDGAWKWKSQSAEFRGLSYAVTQPPGTPANLITTAGYKDNSNGVHRLSRLKGSSAILYEKRTSASGNIYEVYINPTPGNAMNFGEGVKYNNGGNASAFRHNGTAKALRADGAVASYKMSRLITASWEVN